jgi:hypothetical protein
VPAAAVIPALVRYRISVAFKKFVVGLSDWYGSELWFGTRYQFFVRVRAVAFGWSLRCEQDYFERLKCSMRDLCPNTGAWNNGTRFRPSFFGFVG